MSKRAVLAFERRFGCKLLRDSHLRQASYECEMGMRIFWIDFLGTPAEAGYKSSAQEVLRASYGVR